MAGTNLAQKPTLKFSCTALQGTNKIGLIKPDKHGYYRMLVGALNFHNCVGIYYQYETSKVMFEESGTFMRKMKAGNLYGEREHPEWLPGWSFDDYANRLRQIDGRNVSHHIRSVELDFGEKNSRGDEIVLIYADVKPDRDHGPALKAGLENPHQNVCFSLRSLVSDVRRGSGLDRTIDELITFDWVTEPGISKAMKWNAPGLECRDSFIVGEYERECPIDLLRGLVSRKQELGRIGNEAAAQDARDLSALIERIDGKKYGLEKPRVLF